jgi:hypothetical protein
MPDKEKKLYKNTVDITGMVFGQLTVVQRTPRRQNNHILWECLCVCGKTVYGRSHKLRAGDILSCGCSSRSALSRQNYASMTPAEKAERRRVKANETAARWRQANPDKVKVVQRERYQRTKTYQQERAALHRAQDRDGWRAYSRKIMNARCAVAADSYIKQRLRSENTPPTPEIIAAKREHLLTTRLIKEIRNECKIRS